MNNRLPNDRFDDSSSLASWAAPVALAVVGALVAGVLLYYFLRPQEPELVTPTPAEVQPPPVTEPPPVTTAAEPEEPEPAPTEPEPEPLPSLSNSDENVLAALQTALPQPSALKYIVPESVIQKSVRAIIAGAEGKVVNDYRPIESPAAGMKVTRLDEQLDPNVGQRYRLTQANYSRYDAYVDLFANTDKAMLAMLYYRYYPLLEEAYEQHGIKGSTFHDTVLKAINNVLAVPPVASEPVLVQQKVYYQYFDPKIEKLPDVHKLLIRMGPDNQAKLQDSLKALKTELERQQSAATKRK